MRAVINPPSALGRNVASAAGSSVVTLIFAYQLTVRPWLLAPLVGLGTGVVLVLVPPSVFLGFILLTRNFADLQAGSAVAGGLNAGALVGVLALGVAFFRLVPLPRIRGLGPALLVLLLLGFWFLVGFVEFGEARPLLRELIRSSSIVAVALVALNTVRSPLDLSRAVDVVIVTAAAPAVVAVAQMALGRDRAYGTLAHPNAAATLFGVCLAISLWALASRPGKRRYALMAVLFGVALLSTKSLGGMAQMLVTLLAYPLVARRAGSRAGIAAVVGIILVIVFSLSPIGADRVSEIGTTRSYGEIAQGESGTNSLDWRFGNWVELLEEWREKPLVGYGSGSTVALVTPRQTIPHSDVVRLLVETGVFGLLTFGALFVLLVMRLYRYAARSSYAAAVLAVLAGVAVHGTVNNITLQTATMYALAVLVGSALARPDAAPDRLWRVRV